MRIVRTRLGPACVSVLDRRRNDDGDSARGSSRSVFGLVFVSRAWAHSHRPALSREESRRAISERQRHRVCARGIVGCDVRRDRGSGGRNCRSPVAREGSCGRRGARGSRGGGSVCRSGIQHPCNAAAEVPEADLPARQDLLRAFHAGRSHQSCAGRRRSRDNRLCGHRRTRAGADAGVSERHRTRVVA